MPLKPDPSDLPFFFIIGRPRSGTTLLSLLFDAHPNVMIPGECNFILALLHKFKNIKRLDTKSRLQFMLDLRDSKYFDTLAIDRESLIQKLAKTDTTSFSELIRMVQLSCQSVHDKSDIIITGDKNPSYSSENFHKIFGCFPNARYIHLVRDYHDHIASMFSGNFRSPSATFMAIVWKRSIEMMADYANKYPGNFYTLRYEDLVAEPGLHMSRLCNFLQIPYHKEMLDFYQKKEVYRQGQPHIYFEDHHRSLFHKVDQSRIGTWHSVLTGNQLSAVEYIASKTGRSMGYEYRQHKINPNVVYLILKWQFVYFLVVIFRAFVYSLPVKKRTKTLQNIKNNRMLRSLFRSFNRRNPPKTS
jgi:hypothetical protein